MRHAPPSHRWAHPCALVALAATLASCAIDNEPAPLPNLSRAAFACAIQPILARECSMPACHGNPKRRLQVLAAGRMRLAGEVAKARAMQTAADREAGYYPPLTELEISYNFAQARSMVVAGQPTAECPLLNRPLAVASGGMYHVQGGDIFSSPADAGYLILQAWVQGAGKELCP